MSSPRQWASPRVILQLLVHVVVIPSLPLLISRRWDWWAAWVYAVLSVSAFVISRVLVARRHPDLLAERARFMRHEDIQPWDRILAPLLALGSALTLAVVGLDALFMWSPPFTPWARVASLALILCGYALASYALVENRYFSGVVRIQTDRGHRVISSGPYRWIRHPGYAGGLLAYLATPFLLDSRWAVLPTTFTAAVLLLRTSLEDSTLQDRLEGYRDYAKRVRFRLLPGVW